jgi:hypothetical protein
MRKLAKFYIACRIGNLYNVVTKHISLYIGGKNIKFKLPKKICGSVNDYLITYKTFIDKLVKRITKKLIANKKLLTIHDSTLHTCKGVAFNCKYQLT